MQNKTTIFDLEYDGEYLYVFADKFNIYVFYLDRTEGRLYLIQTDKLFNIENIDEIETPHEFKDYRKIKFFKPFNKDGINIYNGICLFEGSSAKKFTVEDFVLRFTEEIEYVERPLLFNNLKTIGNWDINSYSNNNGLLFVVGYDKEHEDYFFATIDEEKDRIVKLYGIYSEVGDIIPLSIHHDKFERRVYIVGRFDVIDEKGKVIGVQPYFECFFV